MSNQIFIRQSHKNIKIPLIIYYICILILVAAVVLTNRYHGGLIVFAVVIFLLFLGSYKLVNSFGIYIIDEKIYYKKIRKKEIDIKQIAGVKIIKSVMQVNLSWGTFTIKDKHKNILYTAVFLSEIVDGMKQFPYGDMDFIQQYKKNVIMYSIYDEKFIEYLKQINNEIEII